MKRDEMKVVADRIADAAAHIDAATHALLVDIRVFDEGGGWHAMGALSCAHYLNWRIGMGLGAAREKVRVARALGALPRIDEALAHGLISYSKVRALTRVATPETEERLLEIAKCSTASQLEKICRMYRQAREPEPGRGKDQEDRRWVEQRTTDDDMVRISVQLRPEEAAVVMKAIDVSAESGSKADRLVALAEAVLAVTTDPEAKVRQPVEVMVHVDADTMQGHVADSGAGLSAETCRRLCCDAGIVMAVEERGKTIDVGRKTRVIPAALRRALEARDEGRCRFPGCTNRRFLDGHHILHWGIGGETELSNLVLVCRTHHRYVHEYGYGVALQDGAPIFWDPRGHIIPPTGERPWLEKPMATVRERIRDRRIAIDAEAQIPNWDGQPPQYTFIVDGLAAHADRVAAPST